MADPAAYSNGREQSLPSGLKYKTKKTQMIPNSEISLLLAWYFIKIFKSHIIALAVKRRTR